MSVLQLCHRVLNRSAAIFFLRHPLAIPFEASSSLSLSRSSFPVPFLGENGCEVEILETERCRKRKGWMKAVLFFPQKGIQRECGYCAAKGGGDLGFGYKYWPLCVIDKDGKVEN
ncbi:hypothetical protein CDAR_10361 [Caerostris darwini]|uniref:Uncharacterized protein n=1 Tax=Caerostris darwini TaxID=1538125 RepID=A0AAV4RSW7_9ARAC|nr:hypothetical protein CDAR_10361 [Caerostris darwini]